jgi:Zn-dependent peptidase ImmA (M78 family)
MTSAETRARHLAEQFRGDHDLGEGPLKDLFETVHAALGVDVLSMEAGQAEHGLTMFDPDSGQYVIAVATRPHPMRQRSSIAHELCHVLRADPASGKDLIPGERSPQEVFADSFARHVLVPMGSLQRRFPPGGPAPGLSDLSDLVQEFEVSPALAALQLLKAGVIEQVTYEEWRTISTSTLATRFGWRSQYQSLVADSSQPRAPQSLMSRAVDGYRHGVLGLAEVASWYQQPADELAPDLGAPELADDAMGTGGGGLDFDPTTPLFEEPSEPGTGAGS